MPININELTIGQVRELSAMFCADIRPDMLSHLIGKKVLIRDNRAGVFITTLAAVNGKQWRGYESRKIHYWSKAGAVEGIAETGIDLDNSRITVKVPESNGQDLIQICPVSDEIFNTLMGAKAWNPK